MKAVTKPYPGAFAFNELGHKVCFENMVGHVFRHVFKHVSG